MSIPTEQKSPSPQLVLASASPRRREILANAGISFEVVASNIDERATPGETAEQLVRRLSTEKALATQATIYGMPGMPELRGRPLLGADTVVVIDSEILGKPGSLEEARYMLQRLAGGVHQVQTGVALLLPSGGSEHTLDVRVSTTLVYFRHMLPAQVEEYIASGEPFDKAGGYGIQGLASKYVEKIEGCYFNVVGLPIGLVCTMLEEHTNASA